MKFLSWRASWIIGLLMFSATSYASEVAKLSIDNGNYRLELPYLELVMPNEAYTAVLTSTDGTHCSVDYSTVRQLPLDITVDKCKLTKLSIGADGWFLDVPYIEENLPFGKKVYNSLFHSDTGEVFTTEGFIQGAKQCCSTSKPSNCPHLDDIPYSSENADKFLGMGIDSDRDWFKQSVCINGTREQITASEASFSTHLIYDYTSLLKSMKIEADGNVSIKGIFEIHADAKYEKIVKKRDYAQAFILEYDVKLGTQSYRLDTVNPLNHTGLSAVDGGSCYFRQICGDQYVHQVEHGGTVWVEMDFQFAERFQKKEFNASFKAKLDKTICSQCGEALPFSMDFELSINKLSKATRDNGSLIITASQTGGYAENLINAIGSNTLSCSLNDIQKCKKVLDDVVTYVQNEFAPSVRKLPAVYGYTLFSYENILGVPSLISDVTPEIKQARLDLAAEYEQRLVDLDKVRNLLQISLSSERQQRMEYLQSALEQDIENLNKAGNVCFSNLGHCLADKCDVFNSLVSYEPEELGLGLDEGLIAYYPFTPESQSDVVINSTTPFIGAEICYHKDFEGGCQIINGYHPSIHMGVSSAKVHMGCTLTLYKYPNYSSPILQLGHGHYRKFSSSVNDKTSSAKLDCPTVTRAASNGTILDMSGNDNHGVVYGTNGLDNGEYSFPYGSFIDVPGNINPSFLTLSAWVNPTDATRSVILGKISNGGGGSEQYALSFWNGKAAISVKKDGGWHSVIASNNVVLNEWSLITGTWDGFSLNIYVNGILKGSNKNIPAGGLDQLGSGSTRIGMWWYQDPQFFSGKMDDIRIYERALSDADILVLYNKGTGNPPDTQPDDETPPPVTDDTDVNLPPPPVHELVKKAYCSILDREADEGGLNNFVSLMTNDGWTAKQLVQALLNSEEFKQRFFDTQSTTEYVTYMYNLLLQREPDPDGLTNWVGMVEEQGWSIIIEGFLSSEEYIQKFGDDLIPVKDGC